MIFWGVKIQLKQILYKVIYTLQRYLKFYKLVHKIESSMQNDMMHIVYKFKKICILNIIALMAR